MFNQLLFSLYIHVQEPMEMRLYNNIEGYKIIELLYCTPIIALVPSGIA